MAKGKVLITGSAGFVGAHLVQDFLAAGFEVRATDLSSADFTGCRKSGAEVFPADLLDYQQALAAVKGCRAVVHPAAFFNYLMPREVLERGNVVMAVNVARATLEGGAEYLCHYSTCDVYGPPMHTPIEEDHPCRPINNYAVTKCLGEQAVFRFGAKTGLPLSVIRPTTIYGPGSLYIGSLMAGLPVLLRERGIRTVPFIRGGFMANLVHVKDISGAAVHLVETGQGAGEAFNVSDDTCMTFEEAARTLLEPFGIKVNAALPYWGSLVKAGSSLGGMLLPDRLFSLISGYLQRRWDHVVIEHQLIPALKMSVPKAFLTYGRGDYDFSNAKLKRTGYRLKYPDMRTGWRETVGWYADQGWIPDPSR